MKKIINKNLRKFVKNGFIKRFKNVTFNDLYNS